MPNLVFIYSIPRSTATGISDWVSDSSGMKLKKTKVGRADDRLCALPNPSTGGLANYISYTPWIDDKTGLQRLDEKGNKLTLQDKMEEKWGKPKGFFSNLLAPRYFKGDTATLSYFQHMSWKLKDGATVLDLDNMDDEMGYYVLLASSKVANSEKEWREHKWPKAQYYIALENESDELKYQKSRKKTQAMAALEDVDMTDTYKRKFVALLGIAQPRASSKMSNAQAHNTLTLYIENSSFLPNSPIDKFMALFTQLKTKHGRDRLEAMYLLKQGVELRIIMDKQETYTYLRSVGPLVIGERYDEAIDFILNPKKATEVDELKKEIQEKF